MAPPLASSTLSSPSFSFSLTAAASSSSPSGRSFLVCGGGGGVSSRRPSLAMTATTTTFGFDSLKDTFSVDVGRAEGRPLDVPLVAPFTIASSCLDAVANVAVRVELRSGAVGWGEAPVLPSVTAEDQPVALAAAAEACAFLVRSPPATLGAALANLARLLPGHQFASVRAAVEMALIDAVANSICIPLWSLFGGVSDSITTDITIPIVSPSEAAELAAKYRKQGFSTLKLKDIHLIKQLKFLISFMKWGLLLFSLSNLFIEMIGKVFVTLVMWQKRNIA